MKIHNSNPFLDGFSVSAGQLITTLPVWGPEFKLSFEIYFNSFSTDIAQIIQFKPKHNCETDRNCEGIPEFFELHGEVYIHMYIYEVYVHYNVSVKNWTKIEINLFKKLAIDEKVKFHTFFEIPIIYSDLSRSI